MAYRIGQQVSLWQIEQDFGSTELQVVKEVIVTITEIKRGVPGEFTGEPVSSQSLRGTDSDGKVYEKHWNLWPESQTSDFMDSWSLRDDGEGEGSQKFWIPKEAVSIYDLVHRHHFTVVDPAGRSIIPKGDVEYCTKHNRYLHQGDTCFLCLVGK
jgi:hypothetical protein